MRYIKLKFALLIGFLAVLLFLVSGCGNKECKVASDCATDSCHTAICMDGVCKENPIPNCCGNGIKEKGENECTCPQDYGRCDKKKAPNDLMGYACLQDECVLKIKSQTDKRENFDMRDSKFTSVVTLDYENPFSTKESVFDFKFELKDVRNSVTVVVDYITIKKIEVYAKFNNEELLVGEKEINKKFWMRGDIIRDFVPVTRTFEKDTMNAEQITVKIYYEYFIKGESSPRINTFSKTIRSPIDFVVPGYDVECDIKACDDNNPGTREIGCYPNTNICEYETVRNVCGNFECERGENKCTCPSDCGTCERPYGNYLEYVCSNDKCQTKLKDDVSQQEQVFTDTKSVTGIAKINIESYVNQPFNQLTDKFKVRLELSAKYDNLIGSLKITKIEVLENAVLLGKQELSDTRLTNVGDATVIEVPLSYKADNLEEDKRVKVNVHLYYQYKNSKGETLTEYDKVLTSIITSKLVFVKPDVQ